MRGSQGQGSTQSWHSSPALSPNKSGSAAFLSPSVSTSFVGRAKQDPSLRSCTHTCLVTNELRTSPMAIVEPTPLTSITFRNRTILIKRDDVLSYASITGSKLRKFHTLIQPGALQRFDHVISFGGAQSNAMLSLAALCSHERKPFVYLTREIPSHLATSPGNFSNALKLGMKHIALTHEEFRATFTDKAPSETGNAACSITSKYFAAQGLSNPLFIPQGGAWPGAEPGVAHLAGELREQFAHLRACGSLVLKKPVVFIASGTGATALFLSKHLGDVATVVAVPVSGDERYLIKQMRWLAAYDTSDCNSHRMPELKRFVFPSVLRPRLRGSFADVRPEKLLIWQELLRATNGDIEFDLVYAPKAWEEVMTAVQEGRLAANGEDLVYYHSGGVEGNASMLERFKRKGLL